MPATARSHGRPIGDNTSGLGQLGQRFLELAGDPNPNLLFTRQWNDIGNDTSGLDP